MVLFYFGWGDGFDDDIDNDGTDLALLTVVAPDITDCGTE